VSSNVRIVVLVSGEIRSPADVFRDPDCPAVQGELRHGPRPGCAAAAVWRLSSTGSPPRMFEEGISTAGCTGDRNDPAGKTDGRVRPGCQRAAPTMAPRRVAARAAMSGTERGPDYSEEGRGMQLHRAGDEARTSCEAQWTERAGRRLVGGGHHRVRGAPRRCMEYLSVHPYHWALDPVDWGFTARVGSSAGT